MAAFLALGVLFTPVYFVLVERGLRAFRPLRPKYCSIYEPVLLAARAPLEGAPRRPTCTCSNGTPFKNLIWRRLGVRIGRRVFDDGCYLTERTMAVIGDDCVLNAGSKIQCHSQEDSTFKSDADHGRRRLHARGRLHGPLRRDDGRRLGPRPRFLSHEGRGDPGPRAVGGKPREGDAGDSATARTSPHAGPGARGSARCHCRPGRPGVLARRAPRRRVHPASRGGRSIRSPASPATRRRCPRDLVGGAAAAGGRAGGAAQLGAAGRARQGARRAVGRARGGDRLLAAPDGPAAALPADDRARLVADAAARRPPGRVRAARARRLPGRRPPARAGPGRAVVRDRVRPDRRRRRRGRRAGRRHVLRVRLRGAGRAWCCGCGTGPTCSTPTAPPGSPAITSPRSR